MSPLVQLLVVLTVVLAVAVGATLVVLRLLAAVRAAGARVRIVHAGASLHVRARALPPGAGRELAGLQLRLRDSTRATAAHLAAGAPAPLAELAADIDATARRLDRRLAELVREPDSGAARAELPRLRREVGDICAAGADVRASVRSSARPPGGLDEAATLAREAAAVRRALEELRHGDVHIPRARPIADRR